MASSSPVPAWSQIPDDILALVIDRLGSAPSDHHHHRTSRRRFSFSKMWTQILRLAVRFDRHGFKVAGGFKNVCRARQRSLSADHARFRARRRLPTLPHNATCIGSTDDWLAINCTDEKNTRTYFLHNPLSDTTVPLPELNAVIGNVSKLFEVRKVLMRSGPHDVIAVLTNNWNYPFILVRPGNGVWLPEPQTAPFIYIMDVAFLGDKLYGFTHTKDLVSFGIDFDSNGIPKADANEFEFEYKEEEQILEEYEEECALDELRDKTGDDMVLEGITYLKDTEVPYEPHDIIAVIWYLVESRGKLLMVRRHLQVPTYSGNYTRKVEVFEAYASKGEWVPISHGLGGQALFISKRFCKSISAYGDVEEDTIHFADTGEIFNIKSQTISPPKMVVDHWQSMWIFSPEVMV
ncbi:unnamed protein product [Alopecurus aequalis]